MNGNNVFYAMLFAGDWSGKEFNDALVNYLTLETGYSREDVISYVDAINDYEIEELEWYCSKSAFNFETEVAGVTSYVEKKTGLPMLKVLMLNKAEEEFHNLLEESFDRVSVLLTA